MYHFRPIDPLVEIALLGVLLCYIVKAGADHAYYYGQTRPLMRMRGLLQKIFRPDIDHEHRDTYLSIIAAAPGKRFLRWTEIHNTITLTSWPIYGLLLFAGVSPLSIIGLTCVAYPLIFQPLINHAHGHPFFYEDETREWKLFSVSVPKLFTGRRGRLLLVAVGIPLLILGVTA